MIAPRRPSVRAYPFALLTRSNRGRPFRFERPRSRDRCHSQRQPSSASLAGGPAGCASSPPHLPPLASTPPPRQHLTCRQRLPRELPSAFISPHGSSFLSFHSHSSLNHGEATSPLRPQTPLAVLVAPVNPEHQRPCRSQPCTLWSVEPPPIGRNRHQVQRGHFFPNSGRRRDFSRHLFYSELRLDSFRCELLLAPLKLPVALTCLGLLSSDPATLSCFTSPLVVVASSSPASPPSPRHTGEFMNS